MNVGIFTSTSLSFIKIVKSFPGSHLGRVIDQIFLFCFLTYRNGIFRLSYRIVKIQLMIEKKKRNLSLACQTSSVRCIESDAFKKKKKRKIKRILEFSPAGTVTHVKKGKLYGIRTFFFFFINKS